MKKYVLFGLLSVLLPHHLHAVKYEKNGVTIEVSALQADEYAIDANGWCLTAGQLAKKGLKAFGVTITNNGNQMVTVLPYISGENKVTSADVALLFQYRQKTRACAQVLLGLCTCYAAFRIMTAEILMHGFKMSAFMAHKSGLTAKDKAKDTAAFLRQWKQFSRFGWLGIGQYPHQFSTWFKRLKISRVPYNVFYTGLATMATAPLTWLYFYLTNTRCERACQEIGLASQYAIMAGESIEKVVVVKVDQPGTFGCELFEVGVEDPFVTFTMVLAEGQEVIEAGKEIVSESLS